MNRLALVSFAPCAAVAWIAGVAGFAGVAQGAVLPTFQERGVHAAGAVSEGANPRFDSDSAQAPGFGLFDERVGVSIEEGGALAESSASQWSSILPSRIEGALSSDARALAGAAPEFADAQGVSRFEVRFTITEAAVWRFDAFFGAVLGEGQGMARLLHGSQILAEITTLGAGQSEAHRVIILTPGDYSIFAAADSNSSVFAGPNSELACVALAFKFQDVTNPCLGDVTDDRLVNFADLNVVLSNFGAAGPAGFVPGDADFDGVVDFRDLNLVLSFFGESC